MFVCSPALFDAIDVAREAGDTTLSGGIRQLAAAGPDARRRHRRRRLVRHRHGGGSAARRDACWSRRRRRNGIERMKRGSSRWGALALGVVLFCRRALLHQRRHRARHGPHARRGAAAGAASSAASGTWRAPGRGRGASRSRARSASSRLARVRLAAEAFSYLTLRGIAGEPLKVVLLADRVNAARRDRGGRARAHRLPGRDHGDRRHRLAGRDRSACR